MTICSAEFFSHCLALTTQLKPTSHSRHKSAVIFRNPIPQYGISPRNPTEIKVSSDLWVQHHDFSYTYLTKQLHRSCIDGKSSEGLSLLEKIVSKGYKPDPTLCNKLIYNMIRSNDVVGAARVLEILESHGEPEAFAYNVMISKFCKLNKVELANQVLNRMKARAISPDVVTYNIMFGYFCSRGKLGLASKVLDQFMEVDFLTEATPIGSDIEEVMKLSDKMLARGLRPTMYTHNAILKGLCREGSEGMLDRAFDYIRSLPAKGFHPDTYSYNFLLKALLTVGRWYDGEKLVTEMYSSGCEPDAATYNILISALCNEGKTDDAVNVLKLMVGSGFIPGHGSYDPLIIPLCKKGRIDLAIELLDHMISTGCLPSHKHRNIILSSLCYRGNADEAVELFQKLGEIGYPPDVSSYNTMFSALWCNGYTTRAFRMVSDMIEKGIDPDEMTYTSLIYCLCRERMVDESIELMRDMEGSGLLPTVICYNHVILRLCKSHRIDDAINMLAEMVERGCWPNQTTYVTLIEGFGFAGWRTEAMGLANTLFELNALSKFSMNRLKNFQTQYL